MSRPYLWRALDSLCLALLALYILAGMPLTPFHADEATQIAMSRDFFTRFIAGDALSLRYDPQAPLTAAVQLRMINGTVNQTLIGLSWWSAGGSAETLSGDWDWGADWAYNAATGRVPGAALLNAARLPSALLTVGAMLLMFALGGMVGGRPAAYLAAALFALHPVVLINGRRAMMEGSMLFFSLLTVYAALRYARRWRWPWLLLLGVSAGAALASKHTSVAVVATAYAALFVVFATSPVAAVGQRWWAAVSLVGSGLLALVTFYALNPAWWGGDPLVNAGTILRWRGDLLAAQSGSPGFGGYGDTTSQAWGLLRTIFAPLPQYYEVAAWSAIADIGQQVAQYAASPWDGGHLGWLMLPLTAAGVVAARALSNGARGIITAWAAAAFVVTFVSPVAWERYYLPLYPVVLLFSAWGLAWLVAGLSSWSRLRT